MNIDQKINQRALARRDGELVEVGGKSFLKEKHRKENELLMVLDQLLANSISPVVPNPIQSCKEVKLWAEHCCNGITPQTKERNMRTDAQDKMYSRVNSVMFDVETNLHTEFHLGQDPNPKTVQGFIDAMAAGHIRVHKNLTPDSKVGEYWGLSDVFEFRTHEPNHVGFSAKMAELKFDTKHVMDSITANPEPKDAYADFQSFLTKWEPKPVHHVH
jgi:hypothetical protein